MAEAMKPEWIGPDRVEQIFALADEILRAPSRFAKDFVVENLAAGVSDLAGRIDRLRAELAAANERADEAEAKETYWHGRTEAAWEHGDKLANDLIAATFGDGDTRDELRTRLVEVGDLRQEWGYRYAVARVEDGIDNERTARLLAAPTDRIIWRYVGDWRDADAASVAVEAP